MCLRSLDWQPYQFEHIMVNLPPSVVAFRSPVVEVIALELN